MASEMIFIINANLCEIIFGKILSTVCVRVRARACMFFLFELFFFI